MNPVNQMVNKIRIVKIVLICAVPLWLVACSGTEATKPDQKKAAPIPSKSPAYVFKTAISGNGEKIMLKEASGKQQVVDGTGLVSAPVMSANGTRVAYLKQTWGKSHNIHIKDLIANTTEVFPVKDATRFAMTWSPDGRYFYYSATVKNKEGKPTEARTLNTYDVIKKKVVRNHPTPPPGRMSVSPNNRYVAYITRDQKQPNNPDAWILRVHDTQLNKDSQMGNGSDKKGVLGRIVWSPDSTNLSIASFDLAANGKRENVRMAKYDLTFKEIGALQVSDMMYSPQHFPHTIKVKAWLDSKPQNGKVYGLTK